MVKVYLDTQYPKNLAESLLLLHQLQYPKEYEIIRTSQIEEENEKNAVIFLFDRTKKGIDIITEKHYDAGFKVFAFKLNLVNGLDLFQLSLSTLHLWPKIIEAISEEKGPFIFTYKYLGSPLKKVK